MKLNISETLSLPTSAVTATFGILAVRGAGKSNTAVVMAEEMFAAGLPFVAIDPVGSWSGIRSSADGKGPGLPVPIFGGRSADVPLDRGSGELLAELIAEKRLSCVVDLSEFESEAAKKAFLLAFATRLYRRNTHPLHLFLEEADDYIPQRPMRDEAHLLRAFENIVRRGRARGLGITLITQRSAAVNKSVLTQVETLFAMRTTGPQDRKAIEEWVRYHAERQELVESLAALADGEAWVWSPHWLRTMERVQIRRRHTFDSGATPKAGSARRPATLADVDLPKLSEEWSATIERARADDPKELRRRIAELEKQLAAKPAAAAKVERVEVHVLGDDDREGLRDVLAACTALGEMLGPNGQIQHVRRELERLEGSGRELRPRATNGAARPRHDPLPEAMSPRLQPANGAAPTGERKLSGGERRVLAALVQHGSCSKGKLAILAGYAVGGGGFNNILSALRTAGLAEGSDPIEPTAKGVAAIGTVEALPTGEALVDHWKNQLSKAERCVLEVLWIGQRPMSKEQVAELAGYEASGGGFNNALSKLRTLGLIEGRGELRLSEAFA